VLGSAVHWESFPVPRIIDGETTVPRRELSLPDRTEILRDKSGSTIGWVLLDGDGFETPDTEIICAAISLLAPINPSSDIPRVNGQLEGNDYMDEEKIDILAVQAEEKGLGNYLRIGRGQVVKKGWLETCVRKVIRIC
jgi:hypothetical protein